MSEDMYLTKIKIMTFLECPHKFYEENILGLPKVVTQAMAEGKNIHSFIENFWSIVNIENGEFSFPKVSIDGGKEQICIKNFLNFQKKRFEYLKSLDKLEYFFPLYSEIKLKSDDLLILGVVDQIDKNLDDTLNLVEFKSNKNENSASFEIELNFYKYLVENTLGLNIINGIVFFPFTNNIKRITLDGKVDIVSIINDIREHIKNNDFKHNKNCNCRKSSHYR